MVRVSSCAARAYVPASFFALAAAHTVLSLQRQMQKKRGEMVPFKVRSTLCLLVSSTTSRRCGPCFCRSGRVSYFLILWHAVIFGLVFSHARTISLFSLHVRSSLWRPATLTGKKIASKADASHVSSFTLAPSSCAICIKIS